MTRFIVVRHGESLGNLEERFYGHTNGGLTERGREQAHLAAEYLRDTKIDAAYASDLIRAYETGAIIALPHGLTPIPDPKLREIYAGEWEGRPFDELCEAYREDYAVWLKDIGNARPTGGESVREMAARVRAEMWRLAALHDNQTVLVAIHATPIRALLCEWKGLPDETMQNAGWVPNASVSIAVYDTLSHTVRPEAIGENGFLGELATELPAKV